MRLLFYKQEPGQARTPPSTLIIPLSPARSWPSAFDADIILPAARLVFPQKGDGGFSLVGQHKPLMCAVFSVNLTLIRPALHSPRQPSAFYDLTGASVTLAGTSRPKTNPLSPGRTHSASIISKHTRDSYFPLESHRHNGVHSQRSKCDRRPAFCCRKPYG